MRFGFHLFMVDPAEHLAIARTAEEAGWNSIQVADAPFFPEVVSAPYPYTPDGSRPWPLDLPVLDPWVAITPMAMVTERIRFIPSVLRLAIRQPLLERTLSAGSPERAKHDVAGGTHPTPLADPAAPAC